jgi:ATP-dependent Clp protease ATP-binding subunit ClpA
MTPPPTLQELIDTVRRDAGTDDPIDQLAVASETASDLEQTTDALLGHFVDRCRRAGRSWSEISAALGVTKQAVHKRFAGPLAERLVAAPERGVTFERFTPRARNVLVAAQDAAQASGHLEVGTGHLLLGLYADPESIAAKVLASLQVGRSQVQAALREAWAQPAGSAGGQRPAGPSEPWPGSAEVPDQLPMSSGAKAALRAAVAVALELGHNYIGTEHILLGLYSDPDSPAARVLAEAGAELSQAKARLAELLRGYHQTPRRPLNGA